MKQFYKTILVFILCVLPVYWVSVVLIMVQPFSFLKVNVPVKVNGYGHLNTRIKDIRNYQNVDVLVLGSSHAYRGFDPRLFKEKELSMFNLGSSAQTPLQTEILLNQYLDSLNPKMVIYEVFPNTLSSDGVESSIDLMSNSVPSIHWLKMLWAIPNFKVLNCFIFNTTNHALGIKTFPKEKQINKDDQYISGGFVEKEIKYYSPKKSSKTRTFKFNTFQWSAFKEIVKEIKSKNIKLVLVFAPVTKSLYQTYQNMTQIDSMFSSLGCTYINYNEGLALSDSLHFYDTHHLNQNGVGLFNKKLLKSIPINE